MKRSLKTLGLAALTVGMFATAAAAQDSTTLTGQLDSLNDSGDTGTAMIEVNGSEVTVTIETSDTSPGLVHAQHIHIGGEGTCPTPDADADGDGVVSTPEGQPSYGGIKVSLTTEGDTSPASALAVERFPVADDDGNVTYERTFTLPDGVTAEDLPGAVIVQHGVAESSVGEDDAVYDGPDSPLAEGVPIEVPLPASCGSVQAAPDGGVPTGGGGTADTNSNDAGLLALGGLVLLGVAYAVRRRVTA